MAGELGALPLPPVVEVDEDALGVFRADPVLGDVAAAPMVSVRVTYRRVSAGLKPRGQGDHYEPSPNHSDAH